jgi:methylmalonyl-CoA mutase
VIGITGTGGAGKSSLTDELLRRYLVDFEAGTVAVISIDPTRKRTGGALLGDRIRMNALRSSRVYMRSLATRESGSEVSEALDEALDVCRAAGFDLILVETSGIGQADSGIVKVADATIYVMTGEYGAASQLEKIEMLDYADFVALNKFERRGSQDALRDIRKQVWRNRGALRSENPDQMPVFPTIAAQFNDLGMNALYGALLGKLGELAGKPLKSTYFVRVCGPEGPTQKSVLPGQRSRYLSEISENVREYPQNNPGQCGDRADSASRESRCRHRPASSSDFASCRGDGKSA